MQKKLDELKEQANELLSFGDSHERREGQGMMKIIEAIEEHLNDPITKRNNAIKHAGDYLCDASGDDGLAIDIQVALIEKHEKLGHPNAFIDDIDGVIVWEKVQYEFTCEDFLDLIFGYER